MSTVRILIIILFFISIAVDGQSKTSPADSLQLSDSVFTMKKSPMGAMLRSAILPGWGQIYNESYWKAPIVWAIGGYLAYGWFSSNNLYKDYKDLYSKSINGSSGNSVYLQYREFYRDQRDLFAVYLVLTYFLNLVDAYVDAQLFDFQYLFKNNIREHSLNFRVNLP